MKPLRLLSFLLAGPLLSLAASPRAAAQCTPGPHSGTIAADQTWCAADSPHVLTGLVTVAAGTTLTIEAGSTVKPGTLTVLGHLAAVGTAASPITFTSDGSGWESLTFSGGTGLLRYVDVLKAGWNAPGIVVTGVAAPGVAFEHCNLGPGNKGLSITDGVVSITDSKFEGFAPGAGTYPIVVAGAASRLTLANDTFLGNWANEVVLETGAMAGNDFALAPQAGLLCYRFPGDYEVPAGRTVTLAAGTVVHADWTFTVKGRLVSQGTAASPVTLTSGRWHWGDHTWIGLVFDGGTGHLAYTDVSEADNRGLTVLNSGPAGVVLDHCTLGPASGAGGLVVDGSTVTATSTTFSGIAGSGAYPVVVRGASSRLLLEAAAFSGNASNRVVIETGAMTNTDFTLATHAGLDGYLLGSDFTIPAGRTMTIGPGVRIFQDGGLHVRGRLVSNGTSAAPVTITNGYRWTGVFFEGGTGQLSFTKVTNAGFNSSGITATSVPEPGIVLDNVTLGPGNGGLWVEDSVVSATGSTFTGIGDPYAISVRGATSRLNLSGNTFSASTRNQVHLDPGAMTGTDFTLVPQVGLEAWHLGGDYAIPAGRIVTVAAGTTVYQDGGLYVRGRLVTEGTAAQPVTITNGYRWTGIFFEGGTGRLSYARITNAGFNSAGITATNVPAPGLVLDHATLGPGNGGLAMTDSAVTATSSSFEANAGGNWAIHVSGATSTLSMSGNSFTGTGDVARQVYFAAGAMTGASFTLAPQPGLYAYHFGNNHAIPPDQTVTVDPGTTLVLESLVVRGALVTHGTPSQPVTLTGYRWTLTFDSGSGRLEGTVVDHGGFNDPSILVQFGGSLLLERSRLVGCAPIRAEAATVALRNTVFADSVTNAVQLSATSTLTALHTTFATASSGGTAVTAELGSTATFVNTVIASWPTGVRTDASSTVTMTNTLWDTVPTQAAGNVVQHGRLVGSAAFAADGYHLQPTSAAVAQGVVSALGDDLDGELRPRPAGILPDLGADEIDAGSLIPGRVAEPIAVYETKSGTAPAGGFSDFVLTVPGGTSPDLLVRVDAPAGASNLRLLARYRQLSLPTLFDLEGASTGATSLEAGLPAPAAGAWYLSVLSAAGDVPFTISVDRSGVVRSLASISPTSGGNAGTTTARVSGAGFEAGCRVELRAAGVLLRSYAPENVQQTELTVRLDLTGLASGARDLAVVWPDGDERVLPSAFTIVAGGSKALEASILGPSFVRAELPATFVLEYENTGEVDMPAPFFAIRSRENIPMRLDPGDGFARGPLHVLGVDLQGVGTAGTLPPHQKQFVAFQVVGEGEAHAILQLDLDAWLFDGNTTPVDWAGQEPSFRPDDVPLDGWQHLYSRFTADVGATWGQYASTVRREADTQSLRGRAISSPPVLLAARMRTVSGNLLLADVTVALDAYAAAAGVSLAFGRAFPSDLLSRFRVGPFGRGWTDLYWGRTALVSSEGDVQIRSASGATRAFLLEPGGRFRALRNDPGRLERTPDGLLTLTENDGARWGFGADLKLASVVDRFGNTISLTRDGAGRLTRIAHSSGEEIRLDWGAQGRITRLTDPSGRATLYSYDASGEHLVTVTGPDGAVTRYGYVPATGSPADHALASITDPDGMVRTFSYDSGGRLAGRNTGGGGEPVSWVHGSDGRVVSTDADGRAYTALFDEGGRLARALMPEGQASDLEWSPNGTLASITGPDGATARYEHEPLGHVVSVLDPKGGHLRLAHAYPAAGGAFTSWADDQAGNRTTIDLDASAVAHGIVYPGGSRLDFTLDVTGEATRLVTRRGDQIGFVRNARGQVTRKDLPGGVTETFEYDARGALTRAEGAAGAVTVSWTAGGLPSSVTDVAGRTVTTEWSAAGRPSRRTTGDGYAVVYSYDGDGRLSRLTDGTGALLVSYGYDPSGRLSLETRGNGNVTRHGYDATGRLSSVVHLGPGGAVLSSFTYTFDANGNPVSMTTLAGTTTWAYDLLGRLAEVTEPGGRRVTFEYDSRGNRTRVVEGTLATVYTHDALDETTAAGTTTFAYDAGGNLVGRTDASGTTTYGWDPDGRLVRVAHPTLGTFDYEYDALGRRVTERNGTSVRRFAWEGDTVTAEYDGAGALVARYVGGGSLVARVSAAGSVAWYAFDAQGHTRQMTDAGGNVVASYDYGPYGEPLSTVETVPNPFRYAGRLGVMTDAHGLLYMRARSYDPGLGRFISPDPLGLRTGLNAYLYGANDPVRYVDASGLENPGMDSFNYITSALSGLIPGGAGLNLAKLLALKDAGSIGTDLQGGWGWNDNLLGLRGLGEVVWTVGGIYIGAAALTATTGVAVTAGPFILVGGIAYAFLDFAANCSYENALKARRELEEHPVPRSDYYKVKRPWMQDGQWEDVPREQWEREQLRRSRFELLLYGDPNAKESTPGVGPRRLVAAGDTVTYTVQFENVPTANAPAQVVVVDDALDPSLDWSTARLTEVGWGSTSIPAAGSALPWTARRAVTDWRPGNAKPWWVDASAEVVGGTLRVTYRTIDPGTGLVPGNDDPLAGFLPPDDASGRGRGWFTFLVATKPSLPAGTRIVNDASIVFDQASPIVTNEVFNTIGLPGDVNDDGVVNPADVFYLVSFFYSAGPAPIGIADVNFDGRVDALDLFYLINFLYAGGPAPL